MIRTKRGSSVGQHGDRLGDVGKGCDVGPAVDIEIADCDGIGCAVDVVKYRGSEVPLTITKADAHLSIFREGEIEITVLIEIADLRP